VPDARASLRPSRRGAGTALLLCVAASLWVPSGAAAPSGAVAPEAGPIGGIQGAVVQHTPPVHPLGSQPVSLEIVERGSSSERRTVTDNAGRFSFRALPVGGVRVFLVRTAYGGVPYETRVLLTPAAPTRTVELAVYESTRDRTIVRGTVMFAVVDTVRGAVRVSVVQRLVNGSDRAVLVTEDDPLVFPLPRGAEAVEFIGGWRAPRLTDRAITDTIPVLPGAMQVGYAFGLEPRTRRFAWPWVLPYGATDVEVLVGDPSVRLSGPGFRAGAEVTDAGRRFARWSAGPVPAGGQLTITLDGLPASDDRWPIAAASVLAVLLLAGVAVALARRPVAAT